MKSTRHSALLNTIQIPKGANAADLYKTDLPRPRYDEEGFDEGEGDIAGGGASYPNSARDHPAHHGGYENEDDDRVKKYAPRYKSEDRHKYENEDRAHKYDERAEYDNRQKHRHNNYEGNVRGDEQQHVPSSYRQKNYSDQNYSERPAVMSGANIPPPQSGVLDDDRYIGNRQAIPREPRQHRRSNPRSGGSRNNSGAQPREARDVRARAGEHILQSHQYQMQHNYQNIGQSAHLPPADNYNGGGGAAYGAYAAPPYGRPQAYGHGAPPAAPKYRLPPSSHGSQRSHVRAASNALGVAPAQPQSASLAYQAGSYQARAQPRAVPNGYQPANAGGAGGKYSVNNLKLPSLGPQGHRVGDVPRGGDYRGSAAAEYRHLPPLMERA